MVGALWASGMLLEEQWGSGTGSGKGCSERILQGESAGATPWEDQPRPVASASWLPPGPVQ